jgi:hypothetical protein
MNIGGLALTEFRENHMKHIPEENHEVSPAELAQRLELPFKNLLLLRRALTHRSYANEHHEALEDMNAWNFWVMRFWILLPEPGYTIISPKWQKVN